MQTAGSLFCCRALLRNALARVPTCWNIWMREVWIFGATVVLYRALNVFDRVVLPYPAFIYLRVHVHRVYIPFRLACFGNVHAVSCYDSHAIWNNNKYKINECQKIVNGYIVLLMNRKMY